MPSTNEPQPEQQMLTRKQAAYWLTMRGCITSAKTLTNLASNNNAGKGPPFYRMGWRSVGYLEADLDAWRRQRMRRIE